MATPGGAVQKRPPFRPARPPIFQPQATAVWRWSNFLHATSPPGKQVVHVNLDETSIKLVQEPAVGMLTATTRRLKNRGKTPRKKVPKAATRTAFTHVAVCCDNKEIQSSMPQILLVNKHCYTEASHAAVLLQLPGHVQVWRRNSAWANIDTVCEIIEVLGRYFAAYQNTHHFILGVDAAKVHLNKKVWLKAKKHNMYMYCIPAKVTYALQPLDVYVFSQFKRRLQLICQSKAIQSGDGGVTIEQTIVSVAKTVEEILTGKCWKHAFSHLGLSGTQSCLSSRLVEQLDSSHSLQVGGTMPEYSQLAFCFPRRYTIPFDAVFGSVLKVLRAPAVDEAPMVDPPPSLGPAVSPWHGRTRSHSRLALDTVETPPAVPAAAAAAAPAPWHPRLQLCRLPPRPPSWS